MQPLQPCTTIGILAHVDAGKTSLTERLLFQTGVTDHLGAVDSGDTRTDTGDIERRRGITIRTGVAAFSLDGLRVMLVDTPGHAEFVAEVERALGILDAAVLVVSAVEGIQSHTRLLMRTLRDRGIPTALFVNKIDRREARTDDLVDDIRSRLAPGVLPINQVSPAAGAGSSNVATSSLLGTVRLREDALQVLAMHDDKLLQGLVDDTSAPTIERAWRLLRGQIRAGFIHPLVFGSARTGVGIDDLLAVVRDLLPRADRNLDDALAARVFGFDRSSGAGRGARPLVRLDAGQLRVRDHVTVVRQLVDGDIAHTRARVTHIDVAGATGPAAIAGDIATITGLGDVRVGDRIVSDAHDDADRRKTEGPSRPRLPRPDLRTIVTATDPADTPALFRALTEMAAQDPLIAAEFIGHDQVRVLLFGEVQQQVLQETLAQEYGVMATFAEAELRHTERPVGAGAATRNGYPIGLAAVVGLAVEPTPVGGGLDYRLDVERGTLPVAFHEAIRQMVRQSLQQGLAGWPVTDIRVTVTETGYDSISSTAGDFRRLTPLPLFRALRRAGTRVYEPLHRFDLEIPADCVGPVLAALTGHEAALAESVPAGASWRIQGQLPLRRIHAVRHLLPSLTRGEAAWVAVPGDDRLVTGLAPVSPRTDGNPLDEQTYLRFLRGW